MIYYLLIIIGFLTRFIPHPMNFTAVGATALFSGYYFKDKRVAFAVPLAVMLLSDSFLGFYDWKLLLSVYASFALVVLLGIMIRNKKWLWALPTSLLGTALFFLITNGAVWVFANWYPHTLNGLLLCYAEGLPFVRNNFLGDLTYTFLFFGTAELAMYLARKKDIKNKNLVFAHGKI
ncbi:MAG: hypothetical protein PHH21_00540 [Candidatus Pacebacteria bacterium]|nr:hypothetical protein [Candidatus Paceibacterota bacterium]